MIYGSVMKVVLRVIHAGIVFSAGLSSPVLAHHGGLLDWNRGELGPITGVVTDFAFRFPHIQVYVDITDENGDVHRWAFTQRYTPTILRQHGWTRNSLKPGDTITVMYWGHVSLPRVGQILRLEVNGDLLEL